MAAIRESRVAKSVAERIERAAALDAAGAALHSALRTVVRPGPVEDVLSGVPAGHPLHPAIVAVPIGAWTSALAMDAAGHDEAARRLIGLGLLAAVPASASGASDWLSTDGAERRVGLVHALLNYTAIAAFAASWVSRRAGRRRAGIAMSGFGAAVLSAAGWLGGHLTYAQGVGVDTTAFQKLPSDWTDVAPVVDVPPEGEVGAAEVDGVPVLLARRGGQVRVLADRCTHRGAPLHEGSVEDGCIRCPWHDSVFSLDNGEVRSGPATRPQTVLETRVVDGRVQVRRLEERTLRTNPVGR